MTETNKHIDLKLPKNWNDCTIEQLEVIAATLMKHTVRADRYHPFDWVQVKVELFFLLAEVKMMMSDGDKVYCQKDGTEFTLETWQIHSWCDQLLKWMDDPKQSLIIFPYKTLLSYHCITLRYWHRLPYPVIEVRYYAPSELLQDFTWRQYRYLQEYMELYVNTSNRLVKMQGGVVNLSKMSEVNNQLIEARNNFLAVLFRCEHCPQRVCIISDVQWQVILLWWSGIMQYLQKQYPHCFKSGKKTKRNQKPVLPLDIYVSIVATIQKYAGLDEEKVNQQTFHIVLEQLERIAKDAEEMEKINKKHK